MLVHRPDSCATLMGPMGETAIAVHGCHCPGDMAVHMREVLARPWVGACVPLALSFMIGLVYRTFHLAFPSVLYIL